MYRTAIQHDTAQKAIHHVDDVSDRLQEAAGRTVAHTPDGRAQRPTAIGRESRSDRSGTLKSASSSTCGHLCWRTRRCRYTRHSFAGSCTSVRSRVVVASSARAREPRLLRDGRVATLSGSLDAATRASPSVGRSDEIARTVSPLLKAAKNGNARRSEGGAHLRELPLTPLSLLFRYFST